MPDVYRDSLEHVSEFLVADEINIKQQDKNYGESGSNDWYACRNRNDDILNVLSSDMVACTRSQFYNTTWTQGQFRAFIDAEQHNEDSV